MASKHILPAAQPGRTSTTSKRKRTTDEEVGWLAQDVGYGACGTVDDRESSDMSLLKVGKVEDYSAEI